MALRNDRYIPADHYGTEADLASVNPALQPGETLHADNTKRRKINLTDTPVNWNDISEWVPETLQFDTIASMKSNEARIKTSSDVIRIAGAQGGVFYYDPADTTTTEDGGVVFVTTGGKRIKRVYEQLTPEKFGFVPGVQSKAIRQANWTAFKKACEYAITSNELLVFGAGRYEMHPNTAETITVSTGQKLAIRGAGKSQTTLKIYPNTHPIDGYSFIMFTHQDTAVIDINSMHIEGNEYAWKYETYTCVLRSGANARLIQLDTSPRVQFWANLTVGKTIFYQSSSTTIAREATVASWDDIANTITTQADLVASDNTANETTAIAAEFEEDVSLSDVNTYGEFWYNSNGFSSLVEHLENSGNATNTSFIRFIDSSSRLFDGVISRSNGDVRINCSGSDISAMSVGASSFSQDFPIPAEYTQIGGSINNCGTLVYGQFAPTISAGNIWGGGLYLHPNVILRLDSVEVINNVAAAVRQFSSSGPKTPAAKAISYISNCTFNNNTEYDLLLSNSIPTYLTNVRTTGLVRVGYTSKFSNCFFGGQVLFDNNSLPKNTENIVVDFEQIEFGENSNFRFGWPADRAQRTFLRLRNIVVNLGGLSTPYGYVFQNDTPVKIEISDVVIQSNSSVTPSDLPNNVAGTDRQFFAFFQTESEIIINNVKTKSGEIYNAIFLGITGFNQKGSIKVSNYQNPFRRLINETVIYNGYLSLNDSNTFATDVATDLTADISLRKKTSQKTYTTVTKSVTRNPYGANGSYANYLLLDVEHNTFYVDSPIVDFIAFEALGLSSGIGRIINHCIDDTITIVALQDITFRKFDPTLRTLSNIKTDLFVKKGDSITLKCNTREATFGSIATETITLAVANGTSTYYALGNKNLRTNKMVPNTLTLTAGAVTGTDNGFMGIAGTGVSGKVHYYQQGYDITFTSPPANGTNIDLQYDYYVNLYNVGVWDQVGKEKTRATSISSAAILTSNATPIDLILAQGTGLGIQVKTIRVKTTAGTTDYATNTSLEVKFNGGDVISTIDLAALPANGAWKTYNIGSHSIPANTKIIAQTLTGNPTGGDKAIDIILEYEVI